MIGLLIDLVDILRGKGARDRLLDSVVVRVKHVGFVDAVRKNVAASAGANGATLEAQLPLTRPFVADLVIAYAAEGAADLKYISSALLARHKLGAAQLHDAAIANTRKQLAKSLNIGKTRTFCGLDSSVTGLPAAAALFPEYWKGVHKAFGDELIAAIPGRDFVCFLALPANGEERDDALARSWIMKQSAIAAFEASDNHALSEFAFRVRDGRFEQREQLGERDPELAALLQSPAGEALLARYPAG